MDAVRMDALERYLIDCENKRRRMRDRPSDAVLAELRALVDFFDGVAMRRRSADPRSDAEPEGESTSASA